MHVIYSGYFVLLVPQSARWLMALQNTQAPDIYSWVPNNKKLCTSSVPLLLSASWNKRSSMCLLWCTAQFCVLYLLRFAQQLRMCCQMSEDVGFFVCFCCHYLHEFLDTRTYRVLSSQRQLNIYLAFSFCVHCHTYNVCICLWSTPHQSQYLSPGIVKVQPEAVG